MSEIRPAPSVVTLTLNPAVDVATTVARLTPFTKMRCAPAQHDPGGGGINVARMLARLGVPVRAVFAAGGHTGHLLCSLLDREDLPYERIATTHETREDFTVFETASASQYRFIFPGPALEHHEAEACLSAIATLAAIDSRPRFIVASGSVPEGVAADFFARLATLARRIGALSVVDTTGAHLHAAVEAGVDLIKPNLGEFRALTGITSDREADLVAGSRALIGRGRVGMVALSMGDRGALLIDATRALKAPALAVEARSVSGAGDSFLAALLSSLISGDDLASALKLAVGGGSAALLAPGTGLGLADDVHRLARDVVVTALDPPQ